MHNLSVIAEFLVELVLNVVASQVSVGSLCVARDSDDLWYRATVVELLDDGRYHVMFDLSQREAKLEANDLFPLQGTVLRTTVWPPLCVVFINKISLVK